MQFKLILTLLFVCPQLILIACTRSQSEKSKLKITLPSKIQSNMSYEKVAHSVSSQSNDSPWNGTEITSSSEINCYAVMVGGPEDFMKKNRCFEKDSENLLFNFGPYVGGVPAGETIEIEVDSGERVVSLIAMQADTGACVDFKGSGPQNGALSYPRVIGQKTINIQPGEAQVIFTLPSDLSSLSQIDKCDVDDEFNLGNAGAQSLFGDGRDGDIDITVGGSVPLTTSNYGEGGFSHTSVAGGVPSTKIFTSFQRIINVGGQGDQLTTFSAFSSNEFDVGDEIAWHVAAGYHSVSPDDNACGAGSELWIGLWGSAHITDVSGNVITIDKPITPHYTNISNTHIAENLADRTNPFCRLQITRVPNFNSMTITGSGVNLMIPNGAGFEMNNSGAGQGGLLFMRIKHLILNNPLSMNVSGRGFQGSPAVQGSGIHGIGLGDDTSSNGNGGAGSASGNGGGGGGNVGAGGQNDTTLSAAGQSISNCSGPCFPIKGHKIILGGAGGGDNTIVGGSGGGAIVLHIEQITGGAHTLTLDAQGQPGASGGGGGGAGGVIHLTSSSVNKPVAAYANGGNGDSKGGGGGGGAIEIPMCADNSTEPLANIIAASDVTGGPAGGVGSAAVGDSGDKSEIRNEPALCQ